MSIGSLVAIPELQLEGPARCLGIQAGYMTLQFLASGAEMTQETRRVVRYVLFPGTEVQLAATAEASNSKGGDDSASPSETWWRLIAEPPRQEQGVIHYAAVARQPDQSSSDDITWLCERDIIAIAAAADPGAAVSTVAVA